MNRSLLKSVVLGGSMLAAGTGMAAIKTVPGELIVKLKDSKSFMGSLKSLGVEYKRPIDVSFGQFAVVKTLGQKSIDKVIEDLNNDPAVEYAEPNFIYDLVKPVEELSLNKLLPSHAPINMSAAAPNDPKFGDLWGLRNTGSNEPGGSTGVAGADINALKAWDITKGSK